MTSHFNTFFTSTCLPFQNYARFAVWKVLSSFYSCMFFNWCSHKSTGQLQQFRSSKKEENTFRTCLVPTTPTTQADIHVLSALSQVPCSPVQRLPVTWPRAVQRGWKNYISTWSLVLIRTTFETRLNEWFSWKKPWPVGSVGLHLTSILVQDRSSYGRDNMSQSLHPCGLFPPAALRIRPRRRSPASMWQAAWQMMQMALPLTRPAGILLETDAPIHHPPVRNKNVAAALAAALAAAFFNSINSVQGTTRWTNSFMFGSWGTSTAATAWETLGGHLDLKSNLQWLAWLKRHPVTHDRLRASSLGLVRSVSISEGASKLRF